MIIRLNNNQTYTITNFTDRTHISESGEMMDSLYFEIIDNVDKESVIASLTDSNLSKFYIVPSSGSEVVYTNRTMTAVDFRITDKGVERNVTLK